MSPQARLGRVKTSTSASSSCQTGFLFPNPGVATGGDHAAAIVLRTRPSSRWQCGAPLGIWFHYINHASLLFHQAEYRRWRCQWPAEPVVDVWLLLSSRLARPKEVSKGKRSTITTPSGEPRGHAGGSGDPPPPSQGSPETHTASGGRSLLFLWQSTSWQMFWPRRERGRVSCMSDRAPVGSLPVQVDTAA